jgi:hypothetical protein
MTRAETLRQNGHKLRPMAVTFENEPIGQDLVILAERCDKLARKIEMSFRLSLSKPLK